MKGLRERSREKPCEICGKVFLAENYRFKYCSDDCRGVAEENYVKKKKPMGDPEGRPYLPLALMVLDNNTPEEVEDGFDRHRRILVDHLNLLGI